MAKLQIFLVVSTCLLYLVAAGLLARSVWYFEQGHWNAVVGKDVAELGAGPGSYDIDRSVWHVNVSIHLYAAFFPIYVPCNITNLPQCCSPEFEGGYGWGIFNGILGWTNSATYSTVIAYNVYWIVVMAGFITMRYHEQKGHWPLMRAKNSTVETDSDRSGSGGVIADKGLAGRV